MKELFEVYTKNKEVTREAFLKLQEEYSRTSFANWEQGARLVLQDDNGENILVELDFPTNSDNSDGKVWLCAYEFDGELEDYAADREIKSDYYTGDFKCVYEDMKKFIVKGKF